MIKLFPISGVRSLQIFQLFRFAAFLIVGIYFAKSSLTLNEIGIYETLMLLSGAVSYFWVSGILNSYLSAYPKLGEQEKKSAHFNLFIILSAISLFIAAMLFLFDRSIIQVLTNTAELPFYKLILLYILFNNPSFITEHVLLLQQKFKAIIIYGTVTFIATIIALCLPIYLGAGLNSAIFWLGIVAVIKYVFAFTVVSSFTSFKLNKNLVYRLLNTSYPLVLSFVITGSAQYIDGYLVSKFFGESSLAIFRYGARELPFSLLLANALSVAMIPKLSIQSNLQAELKNLKAESKKLVWLFVPVSILLMLLSDWFFPLIFNEQFAESAPIFNTYLLLIISRLVFPQTILMAYEKTKLLLRISIIELITNILLSIILMIKLGIIGIAIATVIAFMLEKIILMVLVRKHLQIQLSDYIPTHWISLSIIVLVATYYFSTF